MVTAMKEKKKKYEMTPFTDEQKKLIEDPEIKILIGRLLTKAKRRGFVVGMEQESAAWWAVCHASKKFIPYSGSRFASYAFSWINFAINRSLRKDRRNNSTEDLESLPESLYESEPTFDIDEKGEINRVDLLKMAIGRLDPLHREYGELMLNGLGIRRVAKKLGISFHTSRIRSNYVRLFIYSCFGYMPTNKIKTKCIKSKPTTEFTTVYSMDTILKLEEEENQRKLDAIKKEKEEKARKIEEIKQAKQAERQRKLEAARKVREEEKQKADEIKKEIARQKKLEAAKRKREKQKERIRIKKEKEDQKKLEAKARAAELGKRQKDMDPELKKVREKRREEALAAMREQRRAQREARLIRVQLLSIEVLAPDTTTDPDPQPIPLEPIGEPIFTPVPLEPEPVAIAPEGPAVEPEALPLPTPELPTQINQVSPPKPGNILAHLRGYGRNQRCLKTLTIKNRIDTLINVSKR